MVKKCGKNHSFEVFSLRFLNLKLHHPCFVFFVGDNLWWVSLSGLPRLIRIRYHYDRESRDVYPQLSSLPSLASLRTIYTATMMMMMMMMITIIIIAFITGIYYCTAITQDEAKAMLRNLRQRGGAPARR